MLTDSHCHLASGQFYPDLEGTIERALDSGVSKMITISTDLEDSSECVKLANNNEHISAAVGIHPCSVTDVTDDNWLEKIHTIATRDKVAAIGEIGLDYFHPPPPAWTEQSYRQRQYEFFASQLQLAVDLGLNVVVHHRDRGHECWPDIQRIIEPFHGKLRAVFHCFNHSWDSAKPLIEHGHLISFTGIVTFKNAREIQDCARQAAPNSFMVETDAPYLAPVPHRGKRCEPMHVMDTAKFIAELRQTPFEQFAEETEETAESFFRFKS